MGESREGGTGDNNDPIITNKERKKEDEKRHVCH
jgi:hypothetical protein